MDLESEDRKRRLADLAYGIVTREAQCVTTWEDRCRFQERIYSGQHLAETIRDNAEMAPYVAAAREEHAFEIKRLKRNTLERAQNTIDMWEANGWGIAPFWARNTVARLQHIEENDVAESQDDAISAIDAALR
jgi:hypothetical protein